MDFENAKNVLGWLLTSAKTSMILQGEIPSETDTACQYIAIGIKQGSVRKQGETWPVGG